MNFQTLQVVEKPDFYIDVAFKAAGKKGDAIRSSHIKADRLQKSKRIEVAKLIEINQVLTKHLNIIITSFPSIDDLTEFYKELIKCTLEYPTLKKSLGAINWAKNKVNYFTEIYKKKIEKTRDLKIINKYRREYYGRISSVLKQIKKELKYLELSRKTMRSFPSIKSKYKTVAITGFPNIGKTTLLTKISSANPEINDYAFTTKRLNLGYLEKDKTKVQLIDTPGTLNRFDKMNAIEQQAYLAIKYCADEIIYVFDLTEPYPLKDQIKLFNNLKRFDKPITIYLSKTDLLKKEQVKEFKIKYPEAICTIKEVQKTL